MRLATPLLVLAAFFVSFQTDAQAVTYPHFWSQRYGDANFQAVNGVATDASGNVYAIGTFTGTINLGGSNLVSAGGNDIFVAKFNSNGVHQWSMRFGDALSQEGREIVAHPNGQVVISGHFEGSITVPGFPVLTSAGVTDIFLISFATDGTSIYAKRFGDVSWQYCNAIAMDELGGVAIVGAFLSSVNFGGSNLVSAGDYDIFVARFTNQGIHLWSYRFGDANWNDVSCVAIDDGFGTWFGGHFSGTFSFGGPDVSGINDVYIAHLGVVNGVYIWSKDFGDNFAQYCNAIAVDKDENVFITGYLDGTINFGGSDLTGTGDCYLAKFNSAGTHKWSKRFGLDASPQDGRSLDVDTAGNVYFAGHYLGQIDLGGGVMQSSGSVDLFLAKYNPDGDYMWSRSFGNSQMQQLPVITVDNDESIVYGGQFDGIVNFGGSNLISAGGTDTFVAKIGTDPFEPIITSITDIGNDQGRKVKIRFARSGADAVVWPTPVLRYDAFRRDDPAPSSLPDIGLATEGELMIDGWTQVGSVNAFTENSYGIDVPTIGDSTIAQGPYLSAFFVRAATAAPGTFYDSPPDSGYSLDNLAPGIPTSLMFVNGVLVWSGSNAEDFDYFSVYGGSTPSFGDATLIGYTVSSMLNVTSSPYSNYFVTATDFSGNESLPAMNNTPTDVGKTPERYVLSISSYPNPFNPQTTIRYTLPSKGRVEVSVFDLRGAHVATLVDEEKDKGAYTQAWNGANAAGDRVSSGVYFARVTHASGTKSYKLVLLK